VGQGVGVIPGETTPMFAKRNNATTQKSPKITHQTAKITKGIHRNLHKS
jgi:hypothetical protein